MTLTSLQQYKVFQYLGYPLKIMDPNTEFYSPIAISRVNNLTADEETLIIGFITNLDTVYAQILDSQTRMLASQVSDIKVNENEFKLLQRSKEFWVRKLSQATSLSIGESVEGGSPMGTLIRG